MAISYILFRLFLPYSHRALLLFFSFRGCHKEASNIKHTEIGFSYITWSSFFFSSIFGSVNVCVFSSTGFCLFCYPCILVHIIYLRVIFVHIQIPPSLTWHSAAPKPRPSSYRSDIKTKYHIIKKEASEPAIPPTNASNSVILLNFKQFGQSKSMIYFAHRNVSLGLFSTPSTFQFARMTQIFFIMVCIKRPKYKGKL